MNRQIGKEFRAILAPIYIALAFAIVIPLARYLVAMDIVEGGSFVTFVSGLAGFAFYSSLLAIAAIPMGMEFQYRTIPLLLSQPISRGVIWKHKLLVGLIGIALPLLTLSLCGFLASAAMSAAIAHGRLSSIEAGLTNTQASEMSPEKRMYAQRYGLIAPRTEATSVRPNPAIQDMISAREVVITTCALLLPTLGSVTFWTLLARSTLGGMVFTVFSQLLYFGIIAFVTGCLGGGQDAGGLPVFATWGTIYGGMFFLLSWRKFSSFQAIQLFPGGAPGSTSLAGRGLHLAWLRCRPTNSIVNLIRKEIQLLRPLVIIGALLCIAWALAYVSVWLQPLRTTFPEIIFGLTIGFYMPLISLLAGSIALGEEKSLSISAWYLTFPVSALRHWAVKLIVGFSACLFLGILLPFGLSRLGLLLTGSRNFNVMEAEGWLWFSLFMMGSFALSFWAMTLFSNTVRAVIGSIATAIGLCSAAALAYWLTGSLVMHDTILRTLLIYDSQRQDTCAWILLGGTTVILALFQSVRQFRSLQASSRAIVKSLCALIVFIFLATTVYYLLLPILHFAQPIYLFLFILLLLILRRRGAPVPQRADT